MRQIYNDNIERTESQDIPLRFLKIYAFYRKIPQRDLGPAESTAGVT